MFTSVVPSLYAETVFTAVKFRKSHNPFLTFLAGWQRVVHVKLPVKEIIGNVKTWKRLLVFLQQGSVTAIATKSDFEFHPMESADVGIVATQLVWAIQIVVVIHVVESVNSLLQLSVTTGARHLFFLEIICGGIPSFFAECSAKECL